MKLKSRMCKRCFMTIPGTRELKIARAERAVVRAAVKSRKARSRYECKSSYTNHDAYMDARDAEWKAVDRLAAARRGA